MKIPQRGTNSIEVSFRSVAAVGVASICLLFTSCEKEASKLNEQGINSTDNKSDVLSAEEVSFFLSNYQSYKKNGLKNEKALIDMPLQSSVDLMEVVLNSSHAVKHRDKDYIEHQYDKFSFTVNASKNSVGTLVAGGDIYQELGKLDTKLSETALDSDRQFIAIDVEPTGFVNGQLEFTVTVINALIIQRYSYDVRELLTYDWRWGSPGSDPRQWNCEPVPTKYNHIGGACQVASLYIKEYLNPPIKRACAGFYSARIKYLNLRPSTHPQYYNNETQLLSNIYGLAFECVESSDLKNRFIPELIRAINTEIDAFPNPYRMSYGDSEWVTVYAGPSTESQQTYSDLTVDILIHEPQCIQLRLFK